MSKDFIQIIFDAIKTCSFVFCYFTIDCIHKVLIKVVQPPFKAPTSILKMQYETILVDNIKKIAKMNNSM